MPEPPYPQDYVAVYIPEASVVFYGQCIFTEGNSCYVKLAPGSLCHAELARVVLLPWSHNKRAVAMMSGENDWQRQKALEIQHLPQVMVHPVTAPPEKGVIALDFITRVMALKYFLFSTAALIVVYAVVVSNDSWTTGEIVLCVVILSLAGVATRIFQISRLMRNVKLTEKYMDWMLLWQGKGATLPSRWNDASPNPAPPDPLPTSCSTPPPPSPSTPPPFPAQSEATDQRAADLEEGKVAHDDSQDDPVPGQLPESHNGKAGSGQPPQDQHMGAQPPTNHHQQEGGVPQQTPAETTGTTGQAPQAGEEAGQSPTPTPFSAAYESQEHNMDVFLNTLDAREALTQAERSDPLAVSLLVSTIVVETEIMVNNENLHKLGRREQLKRGEKLNARLHSLVRWLGIRSKEGLGNAGTIATAHLLTHLIIYPP